MEDRSITIAHTEKNFQPEEIFTDLHPLQGRVYRDIQERSLRKTYGFLVSVAGVPQAYALVIEYIIPGGYKYLYMPYGPCFAEGVDRQKCFSKIIDEIDRTRCIFLRFSKFMDRRLSNTFSFSLSHGAAFASEQEKIIDLNRSINTLFDSFHPKLRYAIRLAERKEVKVEFYTHDILEHFDNFYNLLQDTKRRNSFSTHSREYLYNASKTIMETNSGFLALGYIDGVLAAGYLILQDYNFAYYLYGGSSTQNRKNSVTEYALWECIRRSHEMGLTKFYLGGVDEKKLKNITNFKTKFVTETVEHTNIDYIFNRFLYILYTIYKKIV